jgi:hypothetical protein
MRIIFMNQYGLQFFAYSPEEIIAKSAGHHHSRKIGHDIAAMAEDLMRHPIKYPANVHQIYARMEACIGVLGQQTHLR